MREESYFCTKTYQMLQTIPAGLRHRKKNSRVFSYACVLINGYKTVVVFKNVVPIAIMSTALAAINPLAVFDKHSMNAIHAAEPCLANDLLWLDVPRYVYPI